MEYYALVPLGFPGGGDPRPYVGKLGTVGTLPLNKSKPLWWGKYGGLNL